MRQKIAAGNWKMNLDLEDAQGLTSELIGMYRDEVHQDVEMILAPPFVHLHAVGHLTKDHPRFHLAAQNLHQEASGAYTGEVAASMLRSVGCSHVIIGHSERRQYFGEDNALLAQKVRIALDHGLIPIYCFGEVLEERENGQTFEVVARQVREGCFGFSAEEFGQMVLAYEPVWAIGTGKTASPEQAQEVHAYLRGLIRKQYGESVADACAILYGGSVKPGNAAELFAQADIDGGLVGGASLKSADFTAIAKAFS